MFTDDDFSKATQIQSKREAANYVTLNTNFFVGFSNGIIFQICIYIKITEIIPLISIINDGRFCS